MNTLRFALRSLGRSLRGGELNVLIAAIVLAVAAITGWQTRRWSIGVCAAAAVGTTWFVATCAGMAGNVMVCGAVSVVAATFTWKGVSNPSLAMRK